MLAIEKVINKNEATPDPTFHCGRWRHKDELPQGRKIGIEALHDLEVEVPTAEKRQTAHP